MVKLKHGESITVTVRSRKYCGVVVIEDDVIYICSNTKVLDGEPPSDTKGYKYGYTLDSEIDKVEVIRKGVLVEAFIPVIAGYEVRVLNGGFFEFGCGAITVNKQAVEDWVE